MSIFVNYKKVKGMLSSVLLFLNIGSSEMILIVFVALLLFGGEKLPEIARGLGKGIRDFKDASEGVKREINNQINSFEEKREEKQLTQAGDRFADEQQNPDKLVEDVNAVPNTMSYNENTLVEDPNANMHTGTHTETNNNSAGVINETPAEENAYVEHDGVSNESKNTTL